ncbi:hypothetical protein ABH37_14575 [Mycobacterium haemophilum]|uniref:Integrase catalytic domain-containing protein n=1 Tax=Mycobacterium haemophilum TaxID=29311 RepID=A0A0I9U0T5_9MYCO|nr:hypothetical protein ABH39_13435 [Mycobacterium haemophilum]KLO35616.1 hypothetical protein ABH38_14890 [Mycobacterium haemophilum]KLO41140.1 hypothetical protein ABH37_14575 [Mycobacterium haemophilum]KLO49121.1 hypothetical protein ABH36_14380 [Mycobacterium haemophilum]
MPVQRRRFNGAGSLFIDPGSSRQNAWVESFNGRLRDELLVSFAGNTPQLPCKATSAIRGSRRVH